MSNAPKTAAVIVAAGRGQRAGGPVPKQWQVVAGKPVISHTLQRFANHDAIDEVILVLHPDDIDFPLEPAPTRRVAGGADRSASVSAGLDTVTEAEFVLIHDVARPCVSEALITGVIAALQDNRAAAPAVPVTDALWIGENGTVTGVHPRDGLFRAQTPQGFHLDDIRAAHAAHPGGAADDVEVARAHGLAVAIVPGDEDNLKITLPADFARAARILERS